MKNLSVVLVCLVLGLVFLSVGCGKVSKDQKKDIAKVTSMLSGSMSNPSGNLRENLFPAIREARERANGVALLGRFRAETELAEGSNLTFTETCAAVTVSAEGATCSISCSPSSTSWTAMISDCSLTGEHKATCKGQEFVFSDGKFKITQDFSSINQTFTSGSMVIAAEFGMNVKGGDLDGKLECAFKFSFDVTKLADADATNNDDFALSSDTFSCKYDGKEISYDDLKSAMDEQGGCV